MLLELDLKRADRAPAKFPYQQRDREMHGFVDREVLGLGELLDGLMNIARHMGCERARARPIHSLFGVGAGVPS